MAADGLITIESRYGPEETMNRFEAEVRARGMTVFAHIDHAAGAAAVGLPLRPTELLIFGNAKTGTPLMQSTRCWASIYHSRPWSGRTRPAPRGCLTTILHFLRAATA